MTSEENVNAQIEKMYESLRADYARALGSKMAELKAVLALSQAHAGDQEKFTDCLMELHRMKGTLGSYGYFELSDQLAIVEDLFKSVPDFSSSTLEHFWQTNGSQVESLMNQACQKASELQSDTN
jgi:HPt (histidine-containing phosphotransfer) domain-containing protein